MSSKLIEHTILALAIISISWKLYLNTNGDSILPIFSIVSIISIFLTFSFDRYWPTFNSERQWTIWNFWFCQLRNVSRSSQNLGLWCILLQLFLAFLSSTTKSGRRDYSILLILILIYCPMILKFVYYRFLRRWKLATLLSYISSIFVSCHLFRHYFEFSWIWTIPISLAPCFLDSIVIPKLMTRSAKSFTLGEFGLVYSSVILVLVWSIRRISTVSNPNGDFESMLSIVAWSLVSCALFSTFCVVFPNCRRSIIFWLILPILIVSTYLICLFLNGLDMINWVIDFFIFGSSPRLIYRRWIVLTFWLLCVACTFRFVSVCWSMPRLNTVHRKFFHLTIGFVVISGLLYDPILTIFSSVIVFDGFIILEIVRLCEVEPIGKSMRVIFEKFLDHQDQGPLVLTPIYLLIGCFVPIWIDLPSEDGVELRHFAGLIAVGVGDAAAAVGGTIFGRTPWRIDTSGRKTMEGTIFGFIAQLGVMICIIRWIDCIGVWFSWGSIAWMIWASFLISTMETFSAQVDNLVLPLFAFLLLVD